MGQPATKERASCDARLRSKTQDQHLINLAVQGAGLTPWAAEVLIKCVHEVYFREPGVHPLRSGQLRYECVAESEGAGKPLADCRLVTVTLTLLDPEDRGPHGAFHPVALRQRQVLRLTEEARDQGGLLSQEDLAQLLSSSVRTIRRDIRALRKTTGIHMPTRGHLKDIGPTVTHKGVAVRRWLLGEEPLEVAHRINHSLASVERYIQHFCRVVFLLWKRLKPLEIALAVGISSANVQTYLDLYERYHRYGRYRARFEEIEIIAGPHYEAEDQKKGPGRPASSSGEGRRK